MSVTRTLRTLLLYLSLISLVVANTEKTIFLGPEPISIPQTKPTLADLHLQTLSPKNTTIRTNLQRVFPSKDAPNGVETWFLLEGLTEGQRYEVRVCWAATQPTSFRLDTYSLEAVFASPDLITSLAQYSESLQSSSASSPSPSVHSHHSQPRQPPATPSSILLLQVSAVADYFTNNAALMASPPPVLVDIILDPFLANVVPQSLVPTAIYILLTAAVAGVVARIVPGKLRAMVRAADTVAVEENAAAERQRGEKSENRGSGDEVFREENMVRIPQAGVEESGRVLRKRDGQQRNTLQ